MEGLIELLKTVLRGPTPLRPHSVGAPTPKRHYFSACQFKQHIRSRLKRQRGDLGLLLLLHWGFCLYWFAFGLGVVLCFDIYLNWAWGLLSGRCMYWSEAR